MSIRSLSLSRSQIPNQNLILNYLSRSQNRNHLSRNPTNLNPIPNLILNYPSRSQNRNHSSRNPKSQNQSPTQNQSRRS